MKTIDSFFDKVPGDNPPKFKKQRKLNDAEKEDDAKQITSEAENSGKKTSESNSNTAKARAQHFHPEWKATFPWVYYAEKNTATDDSGVGYQMMSVG